VGATNITTARKNLYRMVESVNATHEPMEIIGKNGSAVLIGEADWRSIQETLYLTAIPGMRESIIEGLKEPVENLSDTLDW
jgi:prevent-host-death family protein